MKAIQIHEFGGPEVLSYEEVERPTPAADELLIKVYASGVNPVDGVIRQGGTAAMRAMLQLPLIPGWDLAGIVEEIGSDVHNFQKGDAVYGTPNFPGNGSYAEYAVGKASQFARKPASMTFNEAASVPLAALTGWSGMFGYGQLQVGQRILIQGASGGVGSFSVQFAKAKGAYVIAMASGANLNYLRQLGADEVIDYKTQSFEQLVQAVDIVLEASPVRDNQERVKAISTLKEGGILVSVNVDFPFNDDVQQALAAKNAQGALAYNTPKKEWLEEIARLIDEGKVKTTLSKVYPLAQAAEAQQESATWHVRGKLVLEIRPEA